MRRRLDVEMVRRGIAPNRTEAAMAIRSGKVTVGGRPAAKAGTLVLPDEPIGLSGPTRRFVSRGGEKLQAALDRFGIDVQDARALDAGSSTGGFTECMIKGGAAHVVGVDVGYGQLDWKLRKDPKVTLLERTNVRDLQPEALPYRPDLVTADLSFISLRLALPALVRCSSPSARFLLLIKPQFEAGREQVGEGGVVTDPDVWRAVLNDVASACEGLGLSPVGVMASPLLGHAGNAEFLLHAVRDEASAHGFSDLVDGALHDAARLAAAGG